MKVNGIGLAIPAAEVVERVVVCSCRMMRERHAVAGQYPAPGHDFTTAGVVPYLRAGKATS